MKNFKYWYADYPTSREFYRTISFDGESYEFFRFGQWFLGAAMRSRKNWIECSEIDLLLNGVSYDEN